MERRGGDERDLVAAARTDADAFAELYRRHLPGVHAFLLRRTGSRPLAEDIAAATFERALRNLGRFEWRPGGFGPWLYRIAANELAGYYRNEARRHRREATAAHRDATAVDDSTAPIPDADDELLVALATLRPRYQEVLSLRYLADLDPAEVAASLLVTRPHLAVLLRRARIALRRALEGAAT